MIWEDQRGGNDIYYSGMNVNSGGLSSIQALNDDTNDATQRIRAYAYAHCWW